MAPSQTEGACALLRLRSLRCASTYEQDSRSATVGDTIGYRAQRPSR